MPGRVIPSRHAIAAVFATRRARRPGSAANVDNERAPRFPSSQSSESHVKHTTCNVARPYLYPAGLPLDLPRPFGYNEFCKNLRLDCGSPLPLFLFRDRIIPRRRASPPHTAPVQRATGKCTRSAHELCFLLTPFRINTCKSVSKQTTLTPFRINTYGKHGEGGGGRGAGGTDRAHP